MMELNGRIVGGAVEVDTEAEEVQYVMVLPGKVAGSAPRFAAMWAGGAEAVEDAWLVVWERLRDQWLENNSKSPHTRRSYEKATLAWFDFLRTLRHSDDRPVKRWTATSDHVHQWQAYLAQPKIDPRWTRRPPKGMVPTAINQRLAAVSSFYEFVSNAREIIDGIEYSVLSDAAGRPRANPFRIANIKRAKVTQFKQAKPLGKKTKVLLAYLETHKGTVTGARNYALILTYLLTGWRNIEVLCMRRKDLRAHSNKPGAVIFDWRGKGDKEQAEEIPARAWHAIVHYLELAGRWTPGVALEDQPLRPDGYIWLPLVTHNVGNLTNVTTVAGHLSEKSAVRILRTALKQAGIADGDRYRIHDLRHTHARSRLEKGDDVKKIQEKLHHANLNTTQIYLEAEPMKEDPVDTDSEMVYQQMRFEL